MNRIGKIGLRTSAATAPSFARATCFGYEVQPHKVMRSLGFTVTGGNIWNQWAELLLRVRAVHALCLSRRSLSEGGVRPGQAGPARGRVEICADQAGGGAPHEGVPAGAAFAIAAPVAD